MPARVNRQCLPQQARAASCGAPKTPIATGCPHQRRRASGAAHLRLPDPLEGRRLRWPRLKRGAPQTEVAVGPQRKPTALEAHGVRALRCHGYGVGKRMQREPQAGHAGSVRRDQLVPLQPAPVGSSTEDAKSGWLGRHERSRSEAQPRGALEGARQAGELLDGTRFRRALVGLLRGRPPQQVGLEAALPEEELAAVVQGGKQRAARVRQQRAHVGLRRMPAQQALLEPLSAAALHVDAAQPDGPAVRCAHVLHERDCRRELVLAGRLLVAVRRRREVAEGGATHDPLHTRQRLRKRRARLRDARRVQSLGETRAGVCGCVRVWMWVAGVCTCVRVWGGRGRACGKLAHTISLGAHRLELEAAGSTTLAGADHRTAASHSARSGSSRGHSAASLGIPPQEAVAASCGTAKATLGRCRGAGWQIGRAPARRPWCRLLESPLRRCA